MLSNKEIAKTFEVQLSTLYNWRKTKPKLYRYLQNLDYNFEQSKEINILLSRFAKEITPKLEIEDISFIIKSQFEAKNMDEIEYMHRHLIALNKESLDSNSNLLFNIYDKLLGMNIIEKYILYKRIHNFRAEKIESTGSAIKEYFEEFII